MRVKQGMTVTVQMCWSTSVPLLCLLLTGLHRWPIISVLHLHLFPERKRHKVKHKKDQQTYN